ncbi:MAG: spore germination protein [Bacillaceae bacterium]|nr:spore germination protein [Bacillaceae bacterium]
MKKGTDPLTIDQNIERNIEKNEEFLRALFTDSTDLIFRTFSIEGVKALLVFIDGMVDTKSIQFHALMHMLTRADSMQLNLQNVKNQMNSISSVNETKKMKETVSHILDGNCILLVDRLDHAIVFDAKGGERRSVSEPESEAAIRGPREGFTENLRVNTSLVRRKLKSQHLKLKSMKLGEHTKTSLAIMYLEDVASSQLVEEVTRRLEKVDIDGVLESGYIEELIEDNPWSFFPQIQHTERPDTVAANLLEGRIAILLDGTPFALIIPTTFWQLIQASEDYYERFHISIFLRWLRLIFIAIALFLPALYIAVTTYHQEMLPTSLLLSVASSREAIPFPALIEALIMEISFEALREAGVRLPKTIGQAVSILGALVVGQAAVQAGIVSAPMVIIVSITGIASFTIPRFNLAISIRLLRFPMMILAAILGLYGILIGLILLTAHLCKLRSFGVPYLAPVAPLTLHEMKDIFIRVPWWSMKYRPKHVAGQNLERENTQFPSPKRTLRSSKKSRTKGENRK